jgi:signal transduction histidine kinase
LEVIKEQGNDLMSFVQSYRTFLSVPEPDRELIPAQKILEKVRLLLQEYAGEHAIALDIKCEPAELALYIDEKQLTQILLNLGKNAQQAIEGQKDGRIVIRAGIGEQGKKYISVSDNGPGIPPALLDEIFVPFFTTKKTGTGIGLSLSKQIMRLHGGSIRAVSNGSTTFTLTFE